MEEEIKKLPRYVKTWLSGLKLLTPDMIQAAPLTMCDRRDLIQAYMFHRNVPVAQAQAELRTLDEIIVALCKHDDITNGEVKRVKQLMENKHRDTGNFTAEEVAYVLQLNTKYLCTPKRPPVGEGSPTSMIPDLG
jgi:hypothetical protein